MKTTTGLVVLLLGLPSVVAAAEIDPAECAQLAVKFSSDPRSLLIRELDALRGCIYEQKLAMEQAEQERQAARASQ